MQFKSNMGCFYVLFLVAISIHNSCQHPVFDVPSQEEDNRQDEGEALTEEDFRNALTEVYSDDDVPDEDQSAELFEGDIELSDEDRKAFEEGGVTGLREVVGLSIRKWPKGGDGHVTVPYYIPSGMARSKRSAIARVVLEYQTKTCIR